MSVASFHLTRYPRSQRVQAVLRMGGDRLPLWRTPGLRFWRLLGTAPGRAHLGADFDRWGMFAVWDDEDALSEFERSSPLARKNRELGLETCTVTLRFASGHGRWRRRRPFDGEPERPVDADAPIAVLTRGSVRPTRLRRFYASVPPIDQDLADDPDLLRSVGIGEWPIARMATFTIWRDQDSMTRFAYKTEHHLRVVERAQGENWFHDSMFCRFTVLGSTGTWDGEPVLPWDAQAIPRPRSSGDRAPDS